VNIGNLFIVGFKGTELTLELAAQLRELNPAGIIYFADNILSAEQVRKLNHDLRDLLGEDLLISVDQEGGRVQRLRAVTTPLASLRELGALGDTAIKEHARLMCTELRDLGFNYNYAPCADLDTNPANPVIGERSLGADPKQVSRQVALLVQEYKRYGIKSCAKHFPGHGDTDLDSHLALPILDYPKKFGFHWMLEYEKHLEPFRAAIDAGVDSIMVAHLLLPHLDETLPASLSPTIIQEELRDELGYDGLVISDELTMKALTRFGDYTAICKQALLAGNNLVIWNVNLEDALQVARELNHDKDLARVYEDSLKWIASLRSQ